LKTYWFGSTSGIDGTNQTATRFDTTEILNSMSYFNSTSDIVKAGTLIVVGGSRVDANFTYNPSLLDPLNGFGESKIFLENIPRRMALEDPKLLPLGGNPALRDIALTEALKRPSSQTLASSDVSFLYPTLAENNRDEDLLHVSLGLLDSQPENPQLLNNVVWLELLRGRVDKERVEKLAAWPPQGRTRFLHHRTRRRRERSIPT